MIRRLLCNLWHRDATPPSPRTPRRLVKPCLETLEDRLTPSAFAHAAGGPDFDRGEAVAHDQLGNTYVAGWFTGSIDFIGDSSAVHFTANGYGDGFVAKYSANGNFLWARQMAGIGLGDSASPSGLAVDGMGNVYVTGSFSGTIAIGGHGAIGGFYLTAYPATLNTFVEKLDSHGTCLWANQFFGADNLPYGIAVDSSDYAYVTGAFTGGSVLFGTPYSFPPASSFLTTSEVSSFVVKLDTIAGGSVWAQMVSSPLGIANGLGTKHDIAVDSQGNVYTTSDFQGSADFGGGAVLTTGYDFNVYVSKRDPAGNLIWAHTLTSSPNVVTQKALAVDKSGNVFITGWFEGDVDFDPGVPHQGAPDWLSDPQHSHDAFVAKLDASGNFAWARRMGSPNSADEGHGIAVDAGRVYVTGFFTNTADFGNQLLASHGDTDVFAAQLDNAGNFVIVIGQGGIGYDDAGDITIEPGFTVNDGLGYIAITGAFDAAPGNPAHYGPAFLTSAGANDVFVAKLAIPWSVTVGPKNALQVMGDSAKNNIKFMDARGIVTITMDGDEPLMFRGIEQIVVRSGDGDDVIIYEMDNPDEHVTDLWIDLGRGNDRFLFDAPHGYSNPDKRRSHIHVGADMGDDDVTFRFGGMIMANLDLDIRLGAGRDQFLLEALTGWDPVGGKRSKVRVLGGPGHDEFMVRLDHVSADVVFAMKDQGVPRFDDCFGRKEDDLPGLGIGIDDRAGLRDQKRRLS